MSDTEYDVGDISDVEIEIDTDVIQDIETDDNTEIAADAEEAEDIDAEETGDETEASDDDSESVKLKPKSKVTKSSAKSLNLVKDLPNRANKGKGPLLKHDSISTQAVKEIIVVNPNDRRTSNRMTMFELTRIIGIRAEQIRKHPIVYVNIDGMDDPIQMAKKEIKHKKCPLLIRRMVGANKCEKWNPNEMGFPADYMDL